MAHTGAQRYAAMIAPWEARLIEYSHLRLPVILPPSESNGPDKADFLQGVARDQARSGGARRIRAARPH